MRHPQRRNVTTSMVGSKIGHMCKTLTQNVNPTDIARNEAEAEEINDHEREREREREGGREGERDATSCYFCVSQQPLTTD